LDIPHNIEKVSVGDKVPLFVEFMNKLKGYDPKPGGVKIEVKGGGKYKLSIESSNDYELVKPGIYLEVDYESELSDEGQEAALDLTKETEGVLFKNKIIKNDERVLEVELEVKLPTELNFRITKLDVAGSYELPYLKERRYLNPVKLGLPTIKLL
jgi:hypothetical protein